jgi:hypothetical protein
MRDARPCGATRGERRSHYQAGLNPQFENTSNYALQRSWLSFSYCFVVAVTGFAFGNVVLPRQAGHAAERECLCRSVPQMSILETRYRAQLARGWSYPVGAEIVSEWVGAVPGAMDKPISFSASRASSLPAFDACLSANEPQPIIKVEYGRRLLWAQDPVEPYWSVRVFGIPSTLRQSTRAALLSHGLPRAKQWLLKSRTDVELDGGAHFEFRLKGYEPTFLVRTRESRFVDPIDQELVLEESQKGVSA